MIDGIKRMLGGMQIASSALRAERQRIDVISRNIANARTTSMPDGSGPYRRQMVRFEPILEESIGGGKTITGVQVSGVDPDMETPFERVFDPGHPDRDAEGFVDLPNVNTMTEMADLITAVRSYEANLTIQESFSEMARRALRLAE